MLEVCLKLPVIGLPRSLNACIRLITFISDLIYGTTCFKHAIIYILVNCCQVHAYTASNRGEKKKKKKKKTFDK